MPFGIQPVHIVFVVIVALIVFGPKRLPDVGRWVGRTISEFRTGAKELTEAVREESSKASGSPEVQPVHSNVPVMHQRTPSADTKFCIRCGAPNQQDAGFCNKCGNQFAA